MDTTIQASTEPQGFTVKFVNGAFQTFRYILTHTGRFTVVNPFSDARRFTTHDTFDQAMGMTFADVENQLATNRKPQ